MNLGKKKILVGICGGIAAYKTAELVRRLVRAGAEVKVVMTPAAKEFITPLTLATLSGNAVISDFFTANTGEWHSHVSIGIWADAMVIAPATASTIAKMAHGVADNMLTTTYLSMRAPVYVAPAMDLDMYAHPTTKRNLDTLRHDGCHIIEPAEGELASHLIGKGRMQEPEKIVEYIDQNFARNQTLKGKKILITSGPTHEKLDPVRFIGNYSSGKMGTALALEAADRGADVIMVAGPDSITPDHPAVNVIHVESALEMLQACLKYIDNTDIAILAAAVADFRPATTAQTKIKREGNRTMTLQLLANPDIAAELGSRRHPGQILVGFALETENAQENAAAKLRRKGLDWIVLNSLENPLAGFRKDTNQVTMLSKDASDPIQFPPKDKHQVAADIFNTITANSTATTEEEQQ